jgi:hypothetical protein
MKLRYVKRIARQGRIVVSQRKYLHSRVVLERVPMTERWNCVRLSRSLGFLHPEVFACAVFVLAIAFAPAAYAAAQTQFTGWRGCWD